jgi:histone H3/H4
MSESAAPARVAKPRRRSRKVNESYASYIVKVLKAVHPELAVSRHAVSYVDQVVLSVMEDLTKKAASVARVAKKSTLSARHVQASVRLKFPFELGDHAISSGTTAVTKFMA